MVGRTHGPFQVLTTAAPIDGTYLHAKFVLVRQGTREVVLQGSPNLSLSALCLSDPAGNIEVANLLNGVAGAFDSLLEGLVTSSESVDPTELELKYSKSDRLEETVVRLVRGSWDGRLLTVEASAILPEADAIELLVANLPQAGAEKRVQGATLSMRPSAEAAELLEQSFPVALRLTVDGAVVDTLPTWPYQQAALQLLLSGNRDPRILGAAGSLTLDDDDVMALLEELNAALIIDGTSVWRLAKQTPPPPVPTGKGPRRRWAELDWSALRSHPKIAQYGQVTHRLGGLEATDLQVILRAITDHFRGIGDSKDGKVGPTLLDLDVDDFGSEVEAQSEEEAARQEAEREQRRLSLATRNRLAWQRFVRRFLDALSDQEFVDLVGVTVVATNALIFNHLLALVVAKRIVDSAFGLGCQLELWSWLFGVCSDEKPGFLGEITDGEERRGAWQLWTEHHGDAMLVAAIYRAARVVREQGWESVRKELRDLWRGLLGGSLTPLTITAGVLALSAEEAAAITEAPAATVAAELAGLAEFGTEDETLRALAAVLSASMGDLSFQRAEVMRGTQAQQVDLVLIDDDSIRLEAESAVSAFAVWLAIEPEREYYRLDQRSAGVVAVYDRVTGARWWANKKTMDEVTLPEVVPARPSWAESLEDLIAEAGRAAAVA